MRKWRFIMVAVLPIVLLLSTTPATSTPRPHGLALPAAGKAKPPTVTPTVTPAATATSTVTPLATATSTVTTTPTATPIGGTTRVYYVATNGSDSNPGTLTLPFRTIGKGLSMLLAGDTLVLRGGEYVENINRTPNKGTATAPITVMNYAGERPVIRGLLWLAGVDYWVLDGVNVTWREGNPSSSHMVKMSGGSGWTIQNCEFWGAKSYAALLISGGADHFSVNHNTIHDTYASNAAGQDHLIYANNAIGGVIEHNLLYNSPNGRAIKVGSLSNKDTFPRNLQIRYNTIYNNLGPSNIQFSYSANNNDATRNIFQRPGAAEYNVTHYNLTGANNIVHDNVGWESVGVVEPGATGLLDPGDNQYVDPQFAAVTANDFHPLNPDAASYGYDAP